MCTFWDVLVAGPESKKRHDDRMGKINGMKNC